MAGKRKIFVSHSSKDQATVDRMLAIVRGLRDAGYDPWADRGQRDNLPPGAEWARRIHDRLLDCHVGVVLFNADALRSGWVQKEVSVLCMRRLREPRFQLFAVRLDAVTGKQLEQQPLFRALGITGWQLLAGGAGAQDTLDALLPVMGSSDLAPPTPFDALVGCIRDLFGTVGNPQTLVDAWNALPGGGRPPGPPRFAFEECFARYVLREPHAALDHLHGVLQKLVHVVPKADAEQLRRLVMGLWVDSEAASRLATASARGVAVAVNGARVRKFTAPAYAERAWPSPVDYELVRVAPGQWSAGAIAGAIMERFGEPDDEQPEDAIDSFEACKAPVVVLLESNPAGQLPPRASLQLLRAEFERDYSRQFSKLTLLVGAGPRLPDDLASSQQATDDGGGLRVEALLPALDLDEEARQWQADYDVRHLIKQRARG